MNKILENIVGFASKHKARADKYLDPAMFLAASNSAALWGANIGLDAVSQNTDSYEGIAMVGTYATLAATLGAANKFVLIPAAKKIHQWNKDKQDVVAGAASWIRTAAQIGTIAIGLGAADMSSTIDSYVHDGNRVVQAFAREKPVEKERPVKKEVLDPQPIGSGGSVDTGKLAGRNFKKGLFATYTGLYGKVPKTATVDFNKQLDKLWQAKIKRSGGNRVVQQVYDEQVKKYFQSKPTKLTLDSFVEKVDGAVKQVKGNLDWKRVGRTKGLSKVETDLLTAIGKSLNGNDIITYGLTELMPSRDGELNKQVLDFLLRNAGEEYVSLMPALYDSKTSFGLYQFTEYALFDTGSRKRGASTLNQTLPPDERIVGSVRYLAGDDHHKAAYLFAVNNLGELIGQLNRKQFNVLSKVWGDKPEEIVKFIATAHHGPGSARTIAKRWLDNDAGADYTVSCHGRFINYSKKTAANFGAMH